MAFTTLDFIILILYLVGVTIFGAWLGRRQKDTTDYFLGGRNLPWLAVCFSVVATETSTLTFISIPGLAYLTNLNFIQITIGYLIGRIIIAFVLLPGYYRGEMQTAYHLLGNRYGSNMRSFASVVFQITRLMADGVRLFATAIPLAIITGWSYSASIIVMAVFTILYTYLGGIRAVVWMDVIQMVIYIGGALLALYVILYKLGSPALASETLQGWSVIPQRLQQGWHALWVAAQPADKLQVFYLGLDKSLKEFFTINYTLFSGLLGGAFLSMASHGTDQLIVQRLLACHDLRSSQKALITSGVLVIAQFALFLILGLGLFAYYGGVAIRSDEILPRFIVEGLPMGVSGIIIAGIFAAAMSTLSGSLNSLASSSMLDLYKQKWGKDNSAAKDLLVSRMLTFIWGIVFIGGAMLFKDTENPVVELGLAIASFTYGGLLGAFFLGISNRHVREDHALVAMWSAIFFMTWIIGQRETGLVLMVLLNLAAAWWIWRRIKSAISKGFIVLWTVIVLGLIMIVVSPGFA
ncbi:sodium:solute symporter, partial [candidate division KSB1 bacterium]|nr:sodium:solute symporter [candidate division KSB1 bacterium]